MSTSLSSRLNDIENRITSHEFLQGKGVAKEIPFYIFDYPPEEELVIRGYLDFLHKRLADHHKLNVLYINLMSFLISYLKDRNVYDRCFDIERTKGSYELVKALKAALKAENLVQQFLHIYSSSDYELVILSGVGSVYPLIRSHSLLNNLQSIMGNTPLIMFYPGKYDGLNLKLFGKVKSNPYYRAFKLIQ